jgi:hypothetical protein
VFRPRGHLQLTAEELWKQRDQIQADKRDVFKESIERHRELAKTEFHTEKRSDLGLRDLAPAERLASQRALVETGYLEIRNGTSSFTHPTSSENCHRICNEDSGEDPYSLIPLGITLITC